MTLNCLEIYVCDSLMYIALQYNCNIPINSNLYRFYYIEIKFNHDQADDHWRTQMSPFIT